MAECGAHVRLVERVPQDVQNLVLAARIDPLQSVEALEADLSTLQNTPPELTQLVIVSVYYRPL